MKREREIDRSLAMANCLMLLSQGSNFEANTYSTPPSNHRVFECKTCSRQFPSFQALGGHRASHKKPRPVAGGEENDGRPLHGSPAAAKPKTHECSICGSEFPIGQALGGHMRRHRAETLNKSNMETSLTLSSSSGNSFDYSTANRKEVERKRFLFIDLNLTPLENDLEVLKFGKAIPLVDCFY